MNADARLRFIEPNDGSARLVFGDAEGGGTQQDARLAINARMPGMRVYTSAVRTLARASVRGGFADDCSASRLRIAWDANVSRSEEHKVRSLWQEGQPAARRAASRWQGYAPQSNRAESLWQESAPESSAHATRWQDATLLHNRAASPWQEALPLGTARAARWQDAFGLRARRASFWQEGVPIATTRLDRWQESLRLRCRRESRWQEAARRAILRAFWHHAGADGIPMRFGSSSKWQEMRRPPPGVTWHPPEPEQIICYDPDTLGRLVFWQPYEAPLARLVFVCEYSGSWWPPVPPRPLVVIPTLRSYIVLNSIDIIRARDGLPLPCDAFSMSLDADSWTWSWQGSFTAPVAEHITPGADGNAEGEPVAVLATINGTSYHLLAESWQRSREFAKTRINVRGRGRNALLAAPYAYASQHSNAEQHTAQQLMESALLINGVSSGWTLDFQIADWLVPAGGWNFQGDPISAVLDVADAARALVLPHRTDEVLRILPRYKAAPWHWASEITPDFELPADVVQTEGVEWQTLPDYDRIIIAGTTASGIAAQVTRAGQPGALPMEMQTHPLITAEPPARARGIAALAQAGRIATTTLSMPVLPESGIIEPGHMVRYLDRLQQQPILGAVRGVQLQWSRPVLRQTITLESHIYDGQGT